jgi:hypothetical protein
MALDKVRELAEELQDVFAGRGGLIDLFLPPALFLLISTLISFEAATWVALGLALVLGLARAWKHQPLTYSLGGAAGVGLAFLAAAAWSTPRAFFLPEVLTGGLTVLLCLGSLALGRPLVAWTSHIVRRWPREWYWHPRVRPAYSEVTVAWALYFAVKLVLQGQLVRLGTLQQLVWFETLSGWPATIALLLASYLYGTWRLRQLGGPSVEEHRRRTSPPWVSQQRGF